MNHSGDLGDSGDWNHSGDGADWTEWTDASHADPSADRQTLHWQSLHAEDEITHPSDWAHALAALCAIEQQAHSHPWTRGNFLDSLQAGYRVRLLWQPPATMQEHLRGYYVAMPGVYEAHLLDLTVAPPHQRQGWARVLLQDLSAWARQIDAQQLWLEVRQSNARARQVYQACGYECVGQRKRYYPTSRPDGVREDALVMSRAV